MPETIKHPVTIPTEKKVGCHSCGLSYLCIPHGLSSSELENLDTIVKSRLRTERNEVLYHAGDNTQRIFAVSSGSYKTFIINEQGRKQITGFYLPGEIVGLDGLGGIYPNSTAMALETATVCEISTPELLDKLCQANHNLRNSFMRIVSREISREQQMMMVLGQMSAEARLANLLTGFGVRFRERGFSATEFNLSMSRHDIANYLGLAVETLSRLFKKFQEKGYIRASRRNIKILDWKALYAVSKSNCHRKNRGNRNHPDK